MILCCGRQLDPSKKGSEAGAAARRAHFISTCNYIHYVDLFIYIRFIPCLLSRFSTSGGHRRRPFPRPVCTCLHFYRAEDSAFPKPVDFFSRHFLLLVTHALAVSASFCTRKGPYEHEYEHALGGSQSNEIDVSDYRVDTLDHRERRHIISKLGWALRSRKV